MEPGGTVPKTNLVSHVQALLQSGRLRIARELPLAEELLAEAAVFTPKYTESGNLTFEAWRSGDNDDLVLAVALACWGGRRPINVRTLTPDGRAVQTPEEFRGEQAPKPYPTSKLLG